MRKINVPFDLIKTKYLIRNIDHVIEIRFNNTTVNRRFFK